MTKQINLGNLIELNKQTQHMVKTSQDLKHEHKWSAPVIGGDRDGTYQHATVAVISCEGCGQIKTHKLKELDY